MARGRVSPSGPNSNRGRGRGAGATAGRAAVARRPRRTTPLPAAARYFAAPDAPGRALAVTACAAPGCAASTVLAPFCARHAAAIMGVRLVRTRFGCGLAAARALPAGTVLGPYLGARVSEHGDPARRDGAYLMSMADGRHAVDASRRRGWMAMANHGDAANLVSYVVRFPPRAEHPAFAAPAGAPPGRALPRDFGRDGTRRIPAAFLREPWLGTTHPWLVTQRRVRRGAEMRLDYGGRRQRIFGFAHRTEPSLC